MLEKPLLFPIKPGVVAAWNARTVVIVGPTDGSFTRIHDVATGEERDVSVDELQGIPAIGEIENPEQRWALVRDSTMKMQLLLDRWNTCRATTVPPELIGRIAPTRTEGINLRGVFSFPIEQ